MITIHAGGPTLSGLASPVVAVFSMFLVASLYSAMFLVHSPTALFFLLFLAVLAVSMNFAAIFQIAYESTEAGNLGTVLGVINFLANLGAIGLTLLCGSVKDLLKSFGPAFFVMTVIASAVGFVGLLYFGFLGSKPGKNGTL